MSEIWRHSQRLSSMNTHKAAKSSNYISELMQKKYVSIVLYMVTLKSLICVNLLIKSKLTDQRIELDLFNSLSSGRLKWNFK